MVLPVNCSTHLIPAYYSFYRPRKDERLSWPSCLSCSGWFTHISGHPSAAGRAQDRQSSPARDDVLQLCHATNWFHSRGRSINKPVFSFLLQLQTWHCPHLLVCTMLQLCAPAAPAVLQSIGICSRRMGQTDTVPLRNNNNNNSHDSVYGAVIMTKVIARVHPVHLMNVDWVPGGRQPSDQASRLGLWVRRKLAAIIHIHHRRWYYYSARKLILILPSHEGWKAELT